MILILESIHPFAAFPVVAQLLLHLLDDKALVVLQTLLDVHLELDDVVEHALDLGVELLSQGVGAEGQLLVSLPRPSVLFEADDLRVENVLYVGVHFPLLHQLDALGQAGAHLGQLLFHLLDLGVRG